LKLYINCTLASGVLIREYPSNPKILNSNPVFLQMPLNLFFPGNLERFEKKKKALSERAQ